jgi:hypothetical protein
MPNEEHVSQLLIEGTEAWNAWRARNPGIRPSLVALLDAAVGPPGLGPAER